MNTAASQYTFVTVTYEDEWDLLRLQARSLALFLASESASRIIVIDNSHPPMPQICRDELISDYGRLQNLVSYYPASEIAEIPDTVEGWRSQQILKLMISERIDTHRYVVLDAKNHSAFPFASDFFLAGTKIRSWRYDYKDDIMLDYLKRSLGYFNLNPLDHYRAFLPTITPFVLPTASVQDLIDLVIKREGVGFAAAFLRQGLSEFFLFAAFLIARGEFDDTFEFSGAKCPTVWESDLKWGNQAIAAKISDTERRQLPFFAIHRRVFPFLNEESISSIAAFWVRRGLFRTNTDAARLIRRFAQSLPHESSVAPMP